MSLVRIGLLSDTHGFLDEAVFTHFADCDEVWHAGDFGSLDVLQRLRDFKPLRAVYGNVDGPDLRHELPEDLEWTCGGLRVYMTHIAGSPGRYDRRVKAELSSRRPHLFVCGHSHILRVARDPDGGFLYLNPGAAGHQGWHTMRTLLRFSVEAAGVSDMNAIELGPRGRQTSHSAPSPPA